MKLISRRRFTGESCRAVPARGARSEGGGPDVLRRIRVDGVLPYQERYFPTVTIPLKFVAECSKLVEYYK